MLKKRLSDKTKFLFWCNAAEGHVSNGIYSGHAKAGGHNLIWKALMSYSQCRNGDANPFGHRDTSVVVRTGHDDSKFLASGGWAFPWPFSAALCGRGRTSCSRRID